MQVAGRILATTGDVLEREAVLAALEHARKQAETESGRVVLVSGEAGVGKSTLVRAFAEAAAGMRCVGGASEALFTPRPLGPIHDVAQRIGGPLLDALAAGSEPAAIFSTLLAELAATPTLIVLEDLHWADEATLDAIAYLGRRLEQTNSIVVLTYRDDELHARHPLRLVLGELPSRSTVRISVLPLSESAVEELARRAHRTATGLYEMTGGNPFFVTEVLAAGGDEVPATVRDAVLARASRLSPGARRLLEAVSVVPGGCDLWLVERLVPGESAQLDECLASGVLSASATRVEFRHELARITIEESLRADRRAAHHRAALAALADPPSGAPDPAALAHHADAVGDSEAVLGHAPAAAERASRLGAHREAAAQYARALRFAGELALETRAELCERLSYEEYLTGDFDDALAASTQALESYRELHDVRGEGDCLRSLGRLLWSSGRTREAEEPLRAAVALLTSVQARHEVAMAYAELATFAQIMADYDRVFEWASTALDLAHELGDRELAASARLELSGAAYATGAPDGRESLERELGLALSDELEEVAARAYNLLARLAVHSRDYALADRYLDRGFEYCRDRELGNFRQGLSVLRARRLFDCGAWPEATAAADHILSLARTAGMAPFEALVILGQVRARRGDPDVWEALDRALEMAEPSGELRRLGLVTTARAEAAWLAGDRGRALLEAQRGFALAVDRRHRWFAGELAYWQWKCGELGATPEWIAEPYWLQLDGDAHGAADAWLALGCPYEAARALAESDDAAALLEALEIFDGLGARPAAQLVRGTLRERGASVPRGPRPATRENPAQLTARELEVLALVAEGLRNAEIAHRLVLSPRTVDHHVSAILRKLDVRTRGEAAVAAARLGLV